MTGYGPLFDEGAYEADGHIRIDFGPDAPFLDEWEEGEELDPVAARHVEENIRQLVALTASGREGFWSDGAAFVERVGRESCPEAGGKRLGVAN